MCIVIIINCGGRYRYIYIVGLDIVKNIMRVDINCDTVEVDIVICIIGADIVIHTGRVDIVMLWG